MKNGQLPWHLRTRRSDTQEYLEYQLLRSAPSFRAQNGIQAAAVASGFHRFMPCLGDTSVLLRLYSPNAQLRREKQVATSYQGIHALWRHKRDV